MDTYESYGSVLHYPFRQLQSESCVLICDALSIWIATTGNPEKRLAFRMSSYRSSGFHISVFLKRLFVAFETNTMDLKFGLNLDTFI